jgi:hypothetical protein
MNLILLQERIMKKYFFFFILILLSCNVFAAEKTGLSDSEISKLLTGKWRIMLSEDNMKLDAVDDYLPDGTVIQKGRLTAAGQTMNIEMKATWKIENGKLISTLVSIKPVGIMPVGLTTTDTVVSIDKVKFVFKDGETGERQTYYRISKKAGK